jgi:hypothetical protein
MPKTIAAALSTVAVSFHVLLAATLAHAVEYRLQVVSVHENTMHAFLTPAELEDGASGPGLVRLESSLDKGEVPKGPILVDRRPRAVPESVAKAWGAVPVRAELTPAEGPARWDEVRWEGKPGERSVWLIAPGSRQPQQLTRVALKGQGPMRQFQPYALPDGRERVPALRLPMDFIWHHEERGGLWEKWVGKGLDLSGGIAAVMAANSNPMWPDQVYLVVEQAPQPTIYRAVLGWRQRPQDIEAPGAPPIRIR